MISTNEKLRAAADEMLKSVDGDIAKAAAKLARVLVENAKRPLLIAIVADYLSRLTGEPVPEIAPKRKREPQGRRRQGPHRRPVLPSAAQRAGVINAGKIIQNEIFERRVRGAGKIGDVQMHELRAIAQAQAETATSFLSRGYEDAVDSIWLLSLSEHVTADPNTKVRDAISPKVAEQTLRAAQLKAAEVIRDGSAKVASDLISAARQLETSAQ